MQEHGTKTTSVFLFADGEASWLLLPRLACLLSDGTAHSEDTSSCNRTNRKRWGTKLVDVKYLSHQGFS